MKISYANSQFSIFNSSILIHFDTDTNCCEEAFVEIHTPEGVRCYDDPVQRELDSTFLEGYSVIWSRKSLDEFSEDEELDEDDDESCVFITKKLSIPLRKNGRNLGTLIFVNRYQETCVSHHSVTIYDSRSFVEHEEVVL